MKNLLKINSFDSQNKNILDKKLNFNSITCTPKIISFLNRIIPEDYLLVEIDKLENNSKTPKNSNFSKNINNSVKK